ncbi:MAG: 3-hydroxyanthranilate 3,4-dioxygenase [Planctomycetota bacterium]|nr:MAG: 3-hydroxyanthranilate 3,4-dioxygenase [Planctomycetota bacterium]
MFTPIDLRAWCEENAEFLQPPVGNKAVWRDDRETIIMVVGGPNARNDYHVQPTEEFFYQVRGDMTLRIQHPETKRPHDIVIREGEIYLLPKNVPHSPQRPAGTIGLVVEQARPPGPQDKLRWYCERCNALVHEASFELKNIARDLKEIMEAFWEGDPAVRTCKECGAVVEKPGEAQPPAPAQG